MWSSPEPPRAAQIELSIATSMAVQARHPEQLSIDHRAHHHVQFQRCAQQGDGPGRIGGIRVIRVICEQSLRCLEAGDDQFIAEKEGLAPARAVWINRQQQAQPLFHTQQHIGRVDRVRGTEYCLLTREIIRAILLSITSYR